MMRWRRLSPTKPPSRTRVSFGVSRGEISQVLYPPVRFIGRLCYQAGIVKAKGRSEWPSDGCRIALVEVSRMACLMITL